MRYGLLVIGSGPAGCAAATSYRDAGGQGPICLVTADPDAPYWRPPLSKEYLRGEAREPQPIVTAEGDEDPWEGIELRLGEEVLDLQVQDGAAQTANGPLEYETLVVAAGAAPMPLPGAAADADVRLLRSFADARALVEAASDASTAVVVGSGFIGCEAAASLATRGLDVTLVTTEAAPQQDRLGEFAAGRIEGWLTDLGVAVRCGASVDAVEAPRRVRLGDGTTLEPDLLLVAVGVRPRSDVFEAAGLEIENGRIVVDEHLATTVPGVFAAGDIALAHHAVADRSLPVEHWGDAQTMGALAGRNAAEVEHEHESWEDVPGFWSEIGEYALQYWAWGDGHDEVVVDDRGESFAVWYGRDGVTVGVLTHELDEEYERGKALIAEGAPLPRP